MTDLVIDISAISNKDCRYKLALTKLSGPSPLVSSFMNIVQPTFGPEVSFVNPTLTKGSLSVAALSGTVIYKQTLVGNYKLSLNVVDYDTSATWAWVSPAIFYVEIEDCKNVWNLPINIAALDYRLESSITVDVPAFVDLTNVTCNIVTV